MRIMIVDDCLTTRKLLGHYVTSRGHSIIFAENGLDALEKLGTESVHLVMTDLNMPYMDGIELIRSVRRDPSLTNIPILVITTENDACEQERALNIGANGYLVKPVTDHAIEINIKNIFNQISTKGGNSNG